MSYWLGVVAFVVALLTSVMVHEAGHFLTARAFGMKATQFFVGFGPTLFSRRRGETEYGVKAIPAGGFVKIVGMTPFEKVEPGDEPRAFFTKPLRQRIIVLAAGSVTHFIIALLLIVATAFFTVHGSADGLRVTAVSRCVPVSVAAGQQLAAPADGQPCPAGTVEAPAQAAGLRPGDTITAIGGVRATDAELGTRLLRTSPTAQTTITVRRDGGSTDLPVTLAQVRRDPATGAAGQAQAYALGVGVGQDFSYAPPTLSQGWSSLGTTFGLGPNSLLGGTAHAIAKIPDRFSSLFGSGAASLDGPQSVVGIAQITGGITADSELPTSGKVGGILSIIASVNFFVGVLNLLPLLPFDGGHIAVNVVDRVRSRLRRRRRLASGTIAEVYARFAPVSYAFFSVIAVGSLLILASNIANPLRF